MSEKFEQCAIVELFGHQVIAGKVSEQTIGGQGFVRVDVPAAGEQAEYTKFFGAGAIYAMTPCDEQTMMAAALGLRQKPIDVWKLNLRQPQLGPGDPDQDLDDDQSDN